MKTCIHVLIESFLILAAILMAWEIFLAMTSR